MTEAYYQKQPFARLLQKYDQVNRYVDYLTQQNKLSTGEKRKRQKDLINCNYIPIFIWNKSSSKWSSKTTWCHSITRMSLCNIIVRIHRELTVELILNNKYDIWQTWQIHDIITVSHLIVYLLVWLDSYVEIQMERVCYDLAKQLSYYLYLLFFSFSFRLTIQREIQKSIMSPSVI